MPFRDRIDAGRQLAAALMPYRDKNAVIWRCRGAASKSAPKSPAR